MARSKEIVLRPWNAAKILAVIAAILAILAYPYIPQKTLEIFPGSSVHWGAFTDSFAGGNTQLTYKQEDMSAIECIMGDVASENLCGNACSFANSISVTHERLMSDLAYATKVSPQITMDLSGYSGVWIDIDYRGPANFIYLSLQNHEPALDLPDPVRQLRPQSVGISTSEIREPIYVRFKDFKVSDWWVNQFALHRTESGTFFDRTRSVVIEIKDQKAGTKHYLAVRSIKFVGEWISKENFYLAITIAFAALLSLEGVFRVIGLYRSHRAAQKSLDALNEYNQQLRSVAFRDELTQLLNRRAIHEVIRKSLDLKNERGIAIIVIDIDHFKNFNDTYGHALGDKVLINVAQSLKLASRHYDQIARWGGEEFVILTRESQLENLLAYAEKLRETVASTPVFQEGGSSPIFVTISLGITLSSTEEGFDVALDRADRALYRSKQNGRNCCTFY